MDQSYIGRWIVRLDGYHMIIEHRMRDKHQNADSLSQKTEFYERLEQKQANQAEIKDGQRNLGSASLEEMIGQIWTSNSRTSRVTSRKSSRDRDSIQEGPGALGSVAALKPGPAGTLSHEHKQPLIIG